MSFQREETYLVQKNIKPTAMRLLVLQYLLSTQEAVSLTDIETALSNADKSTIFRSLKTFEENGLVHTIHEGFQTKYAVCNSTCTADHHKDLHPHFHCTECNTTVCLNAISLPHLKLPDAFKVSSQEYLIHGICDKCN
ncbi:Fur family transcriptional regulator, ferric uptake regulator [Pustulibacterium marinum]|uniref:Fur family transcriptional regulator, ferric uptake regulator n=1 Tax=Pustulibacterium marinum TaxID=1224947 RepID=A0A1I7ETD9_9FLAO|nr:transcriptional repressor [Pustulibacterium marinum]SFU27159.1 Fur family transcriptional regulator, ferric uptake regulator [Pustulibacterium marinum]